MSQLWNLLMYLSNLRPNIWNCQLYMTESVPHRELLALRRDLLFIFIFTMYYIFFSRQPTAEKKMTKFLILIYKIADDRPNWNASIQTISQLEMLPYYSPGGTTYWTENRCSVCSTLFDSLAQVRYSTPNLNNSWMTALIGCSCHRLRHCFIGRG